MSKISSFIFSAHIAWMFLSSSFDTFSKLNLVSYFFRTFRTQLLRSSMNLETSASSYSKYPIDNVMFFKKVAEMKAGFLSKKFF